MTSRQSVLVTLGVLGAAGAGLSASSVLGDDTVSTATPKALSAAHAPVGAKVLSAKAGKRLKVRYIAFSETVQPNQESGGQIKCPKSTPYAVSGIFEPGAETGIGQIVLSNSGPASSSGRVWDIGVRNLSPQPQGYQAGAVCIG